MEARESRDKGANLKGPRVRVRMMHRRREALLQSITTPILRHSFSCGVFVFARRSVKGFHNQVFGCCCGYTPALRSAISFQMFRKP